MGRPIHYYQNCWAWRIQTSNRIWTAHPKHLERHAPQMVPPVKHWVREQSLDSNYSLTGGQKTGVVTSVDEQMFIYETSLLFFMIKVSNRHNTAFNWHKDCLQLAVFKRDNVAFNWHQVFERHKIELMLPSFGTKSSNDVKLKFN